MTKKGKTSKKATPKAKFDTKAFKALQKQQGQHEDIQAWAEELVGHLDSANDEMNGLAKNCAKYEIYMKEAKALADKLAVMIKAADVFCKKATDTAEKLGKQVEKMDAERPQPKQAGNPILTGTFSF